MIREMFAIYDSKAEMFSDPFFRRTKGEALRDFAATCNDDKSKVHHNPEDFTLFYIAQYDDNKGMFINQKTPVSLGLAVEYKKPDRQMSFPDTSGPAMQ